MNDGDKSSATTFLFLANILSTIKIEKMSVPKLVEVGSSAELSCEYAVSDSAFSIRWFFNENIEPFYEWSPGAEPKLNNLFDSRIELPISATERRQTLKLFDLSLELSGNYTCSIRTHATLDESRLTQTMIVYSPVQDFELNFDHQHQHTTVTCVARGLFPKPELIIEYNNEVVRQEQHVWRREGRLYDVKSTALVTQPTSCSRAAVVCRLKLPQVDYTAIKKKFLTYSNAEQSCKNKSLRIEMYLEHIIISIYLQKLF